MLAPLDSLISGVRPIIRNDANHSSQSTQDTSISSSQSMMSIRKFKPNWITPGETVIIMGRRQTGKTVLIGDLVHHLRPDLTYAVGDSTRLKHLLTRGCESASLSDVDSMMDRMIRSNGAQSSVLPHVFVDAYQPHVCCIVQDSELDAGLRDRCSSSPVEKTFHHTVFCFINPNLARKSAMVPCADWTFLNPCHLTAFAVRSLYEMLNPNGMTEAQFVQLCHPSASEKPYRWIVIHNKTGRVYWYRANVGLAGQQLYFETTESEDAMCMLHTQSVSERLGYHLARAFDESQPWNTWQVRPTPERPMAQVEEVKSLIDALHVMKNALQGMEKRLGILCGAQSEHDE